jgi:hypothetical protein
MTGHLVSMKMYLDLIKQAVCRNSTGISKALKNNMDS